MSRQDLDGLKQQIPLLDYLRGHDWQPSRQLSRGLLMGLCPLHSDQWDVLQIANENKWTDENRSE